jgi:hypothetical protein
MIGASSSLGFASELNSAAEAVFRGMDVMDKTLEESIESMHTLAVSLAECHVSVISHAMHHSPVTKSLLSWSSTVNMTTSSLDILTSILERHRTSSNECIMAFRIHILPRIRSAYFRRTGTSANLTHARDSFARCSSSADMLRKFHQLGTTLETLRAEVETLKHDKLAIHQIVSHLIRGIASPSESRAHLKASGLSMREFSMGGDGDDDDDGQDGGDDENTDSLTTIALGPKIELRREEATPHELKTPEELGVVQSLMNTSIPGCCVA